MDSRPLPGVDDKKAPSTKLERAQYAVHRAAGQTLDVLNFKWLSLKRIPSAVALVTLVVALAFTVGFTAVPVKNAVTLGVEFGGGYELKYDCYQKPGGPEVTPDTVSAQANSMYSDCVNAGHSNCVVQYYQPSSINVLIPGVSTKEEIAPVLDAFAKQPLGLKLTFSISLSGVLGSQDLQDTVRAAGIAFGVVWAVLLLRYWAAGALGLFITIVFLWLLMIFFNASPSVLSEAAIVAFVLNIGLAADAHILTFERAREELHKLPYGAPIEDGLAALQTGMRSAMVTILEANVTTIICMLTLYVVGVGPVSDFAFMIMISVATSLLVNVLLARLCLRLGWNAGFIRTGAFFGDKGPAYDEEESKKCTTNHLWTPVRKVKFNYVNFWWFGAAASFAVIVAGSVYLGTQGTHPLNLDVDFTAGTALDLVLPPGGDYTCDDISSTAEDTGPTVATCALGTDGHAALRFDDQLSSDDVQGIVTAMEDAYGTPVKFTENTVDPTVAINTTHQGIIAISVAAAIVTVFVALRFGLAFAAAALMGMFLSGMYSICCFALGGYEIDVTFVAAVLTVFSFAVNDCVVVFDFIRAEKTARQPTTPAALKAAVNEALARVLIRSLLVLAMVLVCSICMIFRGAEPLHAFSLAITFGLLSATYTTILIVSPMYYGISAAWMTMRARHVGKVVVPEPTSDVELTAGA